MEGKMNTEVFNREKAEATVKNLRESFNTGKTKTYEWRASQLKSIARLIDEKECEIIEAIHSDLGKPGMEAYLHEVPCSVLHLFGILQGCP
jgi:aldehyde dehydrogenase (NAD+)